jgi:hypothetical protein
MTAPSNYVPCPVCEGAGWWDRLTGRPIHKNPPREELTRCPHCTGTGRAPPPEGTPPPERVPPRETPRIWV